MKTRMFQDSIASAFYFVERHPGVYALYSDLVESLFPWGTALSRDPIEHECNGTICDAYLIWLKNNYPVIYYAVLRKPFGSDSPHTIGVYSEHSKAIDCIAELRKKNQFGNFEYGILSVEIDEPFPEYPHFIKINTSRVRI